MASQNGKTREYYMAECDRLRYKLKNFQANKQKEFEHLTQSLKEAKHKLVLAKNQITKLKTLFLRYEGKDLPTKPRKSKTENPLKSVRIAKLQEEIISLKLQLKEAYKHPIIDVDVEKLKLENKTFKTIFDTLITKNKRVLKYYFDRLDQEDKVRISFATILLDAEYMFVFQKLFEMHVFDYIVDRQNPDNKTDKDTRNLILICKEYTTDMLNNLIYSTTFKTHDFHKSFREFVNKYVEHTNDGEDEKGYSTILDI